jgi:hypothetical protein
MRIAPSHPVPLTRNAVGLALVLGALSAACTSGEPQEQRAEPLPPAVVPAPAFVTDADSASPPADAPAARGTHATMSPPPQQGHAALPRTMSAATASPVPDPKKPVAGSAVSTAPRPPRRP